MRIPKKEIILKRLEGMSIEEYREFVIFTKYKNIRLDDLSILEHKQKIKTFIEECWDECNLEKILDDLMKEIFKLEEEFKIERDENLKIKNDPTIIKKFEKKKNSLINKLLKKEWDKLMGDVYKDVIKVKE